MKINDTLTVTERTFNVAGSIPVLGIFSGSARATVGQVQFLAGLALGAFGLIAQIFSNSDRWERLAEKGVTHIIQGGLNFLRGLGEFILGITIIGSLALLAIQSSRANRFEPVIGYDTLPAKLGFTPQVVVENA